MDIENRFMVVKEEGLGEEWSRRLGLVDVSFHIKNG